MNSLKRTCASLALVLLLAVSVAGGVAQAHVSKQNNGISAELHIPPGDSPKAGEPTRIRISFEDKKGSFRLQDCDCKINLEQSGKVLQTSILEPATKGATLDSFSTITFPRVGVYDIVVTGSSKNGAFPSFKLDYQVRVASGASSTTSTALIVGIGGFLLIGMLAFVVIGNRSRSAPAPELSIAQKRSAKSE